MDEDYKKWLNEQIQIGLDSLEQWGAIPGNEVFAELKKRHQEYVDSITQKYQKN